MTAAQPDAWRLDRLKDVASINASALPADTDPGYEFDYLEISNVDYHGIISRDAIEHLRFEDAPSRARRRVSTNSVLISSVWPNLQAVAFLRGARADLVCSTGFNVVQADSHRLAPGFLYWLLISEVARQYFEATAKGVGYPAVDDKDFGTIQVPVPVVPEQKRIAAYLDASCAAIDAAVSAKRRQIEILEAARRSVIEVAVTTGIRAGTQRRTVGLDWIAQVPAHWHVCRIKRIVSRVDYGISESSEQEGRFAVLKMGHIQDGEIRTYDLEYVAEVAEDLILDTGDLLYNRTNSPDQVGKTAIFRGSKADQMTYASYLVRLRTGHRVSPYFLNYVLNCDGFLSFARKLAIPSVQQSNPNSTRYCRMFVPVPPLAEQQTITEYLDAKCSDARAVVGGLGQQIDTLIGYRKSLIHECVTGQRRVTDEDVRRAEAHRPAGCSTSSPGLECSVDMKPQCESSREPTVPDGRAEAVHA